VEKKRILVIDDDPSNIQLITDYLSARYEIIGVTKPRQGILLALSEENPPDLILLDIVMPDMNGFDVFEEIQHHVRTKGIPVLFLTAESELENVQKGLGMGAQDYLLKPFRSKPLIERIEMRLKQVSIQTPLVCGNLTADPAQETITITGTGRRGATKQRKFLTHKSFHLLKIFLQNEGRLLAREQILESVWPGEDVSDRTIDLQVFRLRKELKQWNHLIQAVYGRGYILSKNPKPKT